MSRVAAAVGAVANGPQAGAEPRTGRDWVIFTWAAGAGPAPGGMASAYHVANNSNKEDAS